MSRFPIETEDFRHGPCCIWANGLAVHLRSTRWPPAAKTILPSQIFGTKASVAWNQEQPDTLWIGHRNEPNQIIIKDASLFYPAAASFADLPGGHSEGYDDSHKQVFKHFYAASWRIRSVPD